MSQNIFSWSYKWSDKSLLFEGNNATQNNYAKSSNSQLRSVINVV